uniref:R3H domain-containing protein n=1 Tax=Romanomermis culicivorax TaxID=13658 RepID=A0A915ID53_ROMCU
MIFCPLSLPCDQECDRYQRNKRLAEALGRQFERYNEENCDTSPIYTDFLKFQYKISSDFIINLEKIFANLIDTVNSSKITQTKSHIFPSMKSESRKIIHEFAAFYNIETKSYDSEPMRNVVAIATKGKSRVPIVLLSNFCRNFEPKKCQTPSRVAAPTPLPLAGDAESPSDSIKMQSLSWAPRRRE